MHCDVSHAAQRFGALGDAAKIEGASDTEAAHHSDVLLGQVRKMVGAEDLPPTHRPPVTCLVAAEIAKIAGAGEIEMTGMGF